MDILIGLLLQIGLFGLMMSAPIAFVGLLFGTIVGPEEENNPFLIIGVSAFISMVISLTLLAIGFITIRFCI